MLPELPRHHIQPRTVWNDAKGRTVVCWDIGERQGKYEVTLLVIGTGGEPGHPPLKFVDVAWEQLWKDIEAGRMQRANV